MKLYEILSEIETLSDKLIDPETGEIDDEIWDRLDELQIDYKTKIEHILCKSKALRADVKALKDEAEVLGSRAEKKLKTAESLEKWAAEVLNGDNFETPRVAVKWRSSKRVEILDEDLIPPEFKVFETKAKVVKKAIRDAIECGSEIPGAVLEERNNMKVV